MSHDRDDVSLRDLIHSVSEDLLASQAERIEQGKPPVFEVESLDVEVSFVVTKERSGGGGLDLKVVRGDLERRYEDQAVQRITLHLVATQVPAEQQFEDFDATAPLRPRLRFDEEAGSPG